MTRESAMSYAVGQIRLAVDADRRGDAAMRRLIVSRLRGDSELPNKSLNTMLKNAGLTK